MRTSARIISAALLGGVTLAASTVPAPSSTGAEKIAFVRAGAVWVMSSDGTGKRRVTHHYLGVPEEFAWSPDGRRIAFVRYFADTNRRSSQSQPSAIYVVNPNGTGLRRITRERRYDIKHLSWAPDGRSLAHTQALGTGRTFGLFVTTLSGGERELASALTPSAITASWSPDGQRVAFSVDAIEAQSDGTYTIRPDGSQRVRLTGTVTDVLEWSPDSRTLLYINNGLMAIGANGGSKRRLVTGASAPAWAPDGKRIAVVRGGDLWTTSAHGRDERRLTSGPELDEAPSWSSDGAQIALGRYRPRRENYGVYVVGANGSGLHKLAHGPYDHSPAWQPVPR